jgi:hypothetical protein
MNIEICEIRAMPANPIQASGDQSSQPPKPTQDQNKRRPHPASINGQLSHSLRIKSAEYWLKLEEADEAVRELEALPGRSWNHPLAVEVRVAAMEVLRERTGAIGQD